MTDYSNFMTGKETGQSSFTNDVYYLTNIDVTDIVTDSYTLKMNLVNTNSSAYDVNSWEARAYDSTGAWVRTQTVSNQHVSGSSNTLDLSFDISYNTTRYITIEVYGQKKQGGNANTRVFMAYAGFDTTRVSYPYSPRRKGVPCFVRGAPILTPSGYRPVESIRTGDLVLTAEKRTVAVKAFQTIIETTTAATAPYHIPAGTLGQPNDMYLSPMHAIQKAKGEWHIPFVLAKYIPAVKQYDVGKPVTYYHIECPNYLRDNLIYDGAIVESFGNKQAVHSAYEWDPKKMSFKRLNRLSAPSKGSQ